MTRAMYASIQYLNASKSIMEFVGSNTKLRFQVFKLILVNTLAKRVQIFEIKFAQSYT